MRAAREEIVAALVTGALAAPEPERAHVALLEPLKGAWRADRAFLAQAGTRRSPRIVAEIPTGSAVAAFDPAVLEPAFGAEAPAIIGPLPDGSTWLALALCPEPDDRWCVALGRTRSAWTAAERRSLAELRPYLELVLGRAVLHAQLGDAREREAAAAEEHERFLNVISHELRNPLAPILMWTSTLRRMRPDDAEVLRAAQAIAQSVNIERRLIEELLDLSRLERGVLEIVMETIDTYRARIAEAQLTLADELPAKRMRVRADSRRIGEVLGALVENAIKFTPHGGQIRVALAQRDGRVELMVSDTGPGIPADVLPRLFTPFVQGKNARGGLGLGLAIAQRVIVPQRGTIEAANAVDGGARFVVTLPETAA